MCVFTILCTGAVTAQNKCWNIFIISENSLMSLSNQFQLPFPRQWFSNFYYHRIVLWIIRLHIMNSYKMYFSVFGHFILTKYFWECCVHWWFILLHCWAVFHCMKPSQFLHSLFIGCYLVLTILNKLHEYSYTSFLADMHFIYFMLILKNGISGVH